MPLISLPRAVRFFFIFMIGAGLLLASLIPTRSASAQPTNDNLANAIVINPAMLPYSLTTNSTGATLEPNEDDPNCESADLGTSLSQWWSFTPTVSGVYTIDTVGTGPTGLAADSVLAVYTAPGLPPAHPLTEIACNDDFSSGGNSRVAPVLTAGVRYFIRVANFNLPQAGTVVLNLALTTLTPTVTLTGGGTVTEGSNATFTVTRTGSTTTELIVSYSISGTASTADYTPALPGTVTIPAGQASADLVVTPGDDAIDENDETITLTLTDGTGYDLGTPSTATATIVDNDTAGVTVTENDGTPNDNTLMVMQGVGTSSFAIVLNSQLTADVQVSLTFNDTIIRAGTTLALGGTPIVLTFTPANWDTPQTIYVGGIYDSLVTDTRITNMTVTVGSTDPFYVNPPIAPPSPIVVNVNVLPAPAVFNLLTPVDNSSLNIGTLTTLTWEYPNQAAQQYDVIIDRTSAPAQTGVVSFSNVTVAADADALTCAANVCTLTLDTANQTLLVNGSYTWMVTAENLVGTTPANTAFDFTIVTPRVTITPTDGTTDVTEGGATDTYSIVLNSLPTASVTVEIAGDADTSVNPIELVFTPGNWNTPQLVTVMAVNDNLVEGAHTGTITHTVSSTDTDYDGLTAADVSVNITDDDSPGFTVTPPSGIAVTEGGATGTFTVRLNTQPTADVALSLTGTQVTTVPTSLTFTTTSWNTPQTVTVTAVDDAAVEGAHTGSIAFTVTTTDPVYAPLTLAPLSITITDNNAAPIMTPEVTPPVTPPVTPIPPVVILPAAPTAPPPCPQASIPAGSVIGQLTSAPAQIYYAPGQQSPGEFLPGNTTWWIIGLDGSGQYYQFILACQRLWIATDALTQDLTALFRSP